MVVLATTAVPGVLLLLAAAGALLAAVELVLSWVSFTPSIWLCSFPLSSSPAFQLDLYRSGVDRGGYVLGEEELSSLIQKFADNKWIKGMTLAPTAPKLHHLLFADDSFLFGTACEEECQQYQNILYTYEIGVEQRVILQKSSVAFSQHMNMMKQLQLASMLGVKRVDKIVAFEIVAFQISYLSFDGCDA
ncbi:hypothetical protein ACLB2K_026311 [Fragaria x ananassa]